MLAKLQGKGLDCKGVCNAPASKTIFRMKMPTMANALAGKWPGDWVSSGGKNYEEMPLGRVFADAVLLPNGQVRVCCVLCFDQRWGMCQGPRVESSTVLLPAGCSASLAAVHHVVLTAPACRDIQTTICNTYLDQNLFNPACALSFSTTLYVCRLPFSTEPKRACQAVASQVAAQPRRPPLWPCCTTQRRPQAPASQHWPAAASTGGVFLRSRSVLAVRSLRERTRGRRSQMQHALDCPLYATKC